MKFKKWLNQIDTGGLACNIYLGADEDPIYCGSMWDIPYWLVDYQLAKNDDPDNKPIDFRHNIRKNINDENGTEGYNGFIITLAEQEED